MYMPSLRGDWGLPVPNSARQHAHEDYCTAEVCLLGFSGSLACALLAFVIPTVCYLKLFGSQLLW